MAIAHNNVAAKKSPRAQRPLGVIEIVGKPDARGRVLVDGCVLRSVQPHTFAKIKVLGESAKFILFEGRMPATIAQHLIAEAERHGAAVVR